MGLDTYSFSLAIAERVVLDDDLIRQLFDCGIHDGILREEGNGRLFLDLERVATDFNEVMYSIIRQLERVNLSVACILSDNHFGCEYPSLKTYTFDIHLPISLSKLEISDLYDYFEVIRLERIKQAVEDILVVDDSLGCEIHVTTKARRLSEAIEGVLEDLQENSINTEPRLVYWEGKWEDEKIWIPIIN